MSGKIYLVQDDETLHALSEQSYASEDRLQILLAKYPDLLAGDQMNEAAPRRWLLVSREYGVPDAEGGAGRWSLDHLFLDQDGIPTLVEVKRSSDSRARREVVAQMLDYAANGVVYWPVEKIRAEFKASCESEEDAAHQIAALVGSDPQEEATITEFWSKVKINLQSGRIRVIFVADEIPNELRRIVEFLNEQMDPAEVLAVEVKQYVGEDLKTLVPRVVGQTAGAQKKKSAGTSAGKEWNETTFFQVLGNNSSEAIKPARAIYEWAQTNMPSIYFGRGVTKGSLTPGLELNGLWHQVTGLWTTDNVELHFAYMRKKPPFDSESKRLELLHHFNEITGVNLTSEMIDGLPKFPLSILHDEARLNQFIKTLDWFVSEIRKAAD